MNLLRLYIKNFMCYDVAFIDFTLFNSALIVGKMENNDLYSNGAGKTTIFKAIEYVLFNQADENLETIIRDDTNSCNIVCDFIVSNQIYRLTRTRTRKGATDLSLYQLTGSTGSDEDMYHSLTNEPITNEKYWKDISGRRAADTEKDLAKLLKVNFKSFQVFVHFMQNDFSGLTTSTPEKRKGLLKDALNLSIYSKLERLAKEKSATIYKEVEKFQTLIESLGDPDQGLSELSEQLSKVNDDLNVFLNESSLQEKLVKECNDKIQYLSNEKANIISKFSALIVKEQNLSAEKNKLEISIKEYQTKKSNVIKAAKDLMFEVSQLEDTQKKLINIDYNQIDIFSESIISNKEKIAQLNLTIQNDIVRYNKLKIPMPDDGECEHCRQPLSEEHRKFCQQNIDVECQDKQINIQNCKKDILKLISQNTLYQDTINSLSLSKQHLESINTKISIKKNEIIEKRTFHDEYSALLSKFNLELEEKIESFKQALKDLENSSANQAQTFSDLIELEKKRLLESNSKLDVSNKRIAALNNNKAVLQHTINQKTEDKRKSIEYIRLLKELQVKLGLYPSVLQAFSSIGIPNLIIQNVLDDLQIEANELLTQLKPGLQLSFSIEKTKGDGTEADTLDINYFVNGKSRYYGVLSGAQKLAVTFSLKLGLSFLLQKMMGVDIKFLLLDEIDQSLDKASVDAFADIVKFFQKDFTILVITHNDRLKDKFSHAILVEQDINMVSRAQVVSSW